MPLSPIVPFLPYIAGIAILSLSIVAALHAVLYKRDPRASVSWAGVILLVPLLGALLYVAFGINRIRRRAATLRQRRRRLEREGSTSVCSDERLRGRLSPSLAHLAPIARVGQAITGRPLLEGNRVSPLINGEQAYPEMLQAIAGASRSVSLLAYIFELDEVGKQFVEALVLAKERGVEVRVLLDDVGSEHAVSAALALGGVKEARFHPARRLWRTRYMNLRNHRKLLVVDGRTGFTGGMNIRRSHLVETKQPHLEQDIHFKIEGPVVEHLQEAFVDDWAFTTAEILKGDAWFPKLEPRGSVDACGLASDPGETMEVLRWVVVAALGCAQSRVRIVTPYFLPDPALTAALNVAALRGVEVDIVLPEVSDVKLTQWASTAMLWQVLSGGCRVWLSRPPFDHSKLMIVDGAWTFVGSSNLDPRSLRLNFEFNVECYDRDLAGSLEKRVAEKISQSTPVTLKKVDGRPLGIKLRDGLARLFMPYL
jgi:cardiolipin synthase A/B